MTDNLYSYGPSGIECAAFRAGYLECALWANGQQSATDEEEATLREEAETFLESEHAVRLIQAAEFRTRGRYSWEQAGHDFYLTREGHGAGFWDRGLGIVGEALTALSKPYGSSDYYPETEEEL